MIASFPGHVVKFEKSGLVSTVCACAAPQVFLGNLETSGYYIRRNITPSIIVLSFVTRIQLKVVSLSEESRNEAKPVLMVFRHVDT